MKAKDTTISPGGLFRCCIHSISNKIDLEKDYEDGDCVVSDCCRAVVSLRGGVWIWQPPPLKVWQSLLFERI